MIETIDALGYDQLPLYEMNSDILLSNKDLLFTINAKDIIDFVLTNGMFELELTTFQGISEAIIHFEDSNNSKSIYNVQFSKMSYDYKKFTTTFNARYSDYILTSSSIVFRFGVNNVEFREG